MQNQMKEHKTAYVLMAIPTDLLEESGIGFGGIIQFTAEEGKIVMEQVTDVSDTVCDGDCEHCPIADTDCDGDCEDCPCNENCEESEVSE